MDCNQRAQLACGFVLALALAGCSKGTSSFEGFSPADDSLRDAGPRSVMVPSPSDSGTMVAAPDLAGTRIPTPGGVDVFQLARYISISDLEGIARPSDRTPIAPPTTALLGIRHHPTQKQEFPGGIRIETRCGPGWCVDGLFVGARVLIAPEPSPEEALMLRDPGGWLERVIRITWWNESFVSVYVAESYCAVGAAHANNAFQCRSFDIKTGRSLGLNDVFPSKMAKLLLAKTSGLFDTDVALDEMGETLDASGFEVQLRDFRFGRTTHYNGSRPEIILCAQAPYHLSGTILELRVEGMPVSYLLR